MTTTALPPQQSSNHEPSGGAPHGQQARGLRRILGEPVNGPARWVLALAVAASVIGSSLALINVFQGAAWMPRAFLVCLITAFLPALWRRSPRLMPAAPILTIVAWICSVTLVMFPSTAYLGFIPSAKTLQASIELAQTASRTISSGNTPIRTDESLIFFVVLGLGFVVVLVDILAVTMAVPALAGLPLLLVLVPAALTAKDSVGFAGFIGAMIGYLLLLAICKWYAPGGQIRPGGNFAPSGALPRGVVVGGAIVLLVALVPSVIPGFTQGSFPQGSRLGGGKSSSLDPMINLGNDLRNQSGALSLNYLTTSKKPLYLRMSTLQNFTGKTWAPSTVVGYESNPLSDSIQGPESDVPQKELISSQMDLANLSTNFLPMPNNTYMIDELSGKWAWSSGTSTFTGSSENQSRGMKYRTESSVPDLSKDILNSSSPVIPGTVDEIFTSLPSSVPAIVKTTAATVTANSTTSYDKAMAIQNYLLSPQFTYSVKTPAEKGYDGSGIDVLAKFLEVKSGYCVHFSAAMAVMAREAGIPSRIAVGYAPGVQASAEVSAEDAMNAGFVPGQVQSFTATGKDAHAWPELFFSGVGWVPFEPTPSRGDVPGYAPAPLQAPTTSAPADENPGGVKNTATATAQSSDTATASDSAAAIATDQATASGGSARLPWTIWLIPAALLILLTPALVREFRRRQRIRRISQLGSDDTAAASNRNDPDDGGAIWAWRELADDAADYGHQMAAAASPRQQADALIKTLGSSSGNDIRTVQHAFEHRAYGPLRANAASEAPQEDALVLALENTHRRLRSQASPWQAILATLVPASFFKNPRNRG